MQIIDRVEVSYFRSAYSVTLSNLQDLNVFVGGNDSGKSNLLKALHLYFNNQTDLDAEFSFSEDLTHGRAREATEAKGRATIWIKVTFNNFLEWESLPQKFIVKKSWNRYSSTPEITFPGNGDINKIMVYKFLNKLKFHYIPAVRGRRIYSHYLAELHDALMADEKAGVNAISAQLTEEINASVVDMSRQIEEQLGFNSSIQPPQHLRDLFRSLDFSTQFSEFQIPLQRRGDGIQARHIPFILNFISEHSKQTHIWAYEEPENSMEMAQAFLMAKHFSEYLSGKNQIFVTSHSPAFYGLQSPRVAKWLVKMYSRENFPHTISQVSQVEQDHEFDEELGLAALVAHRAKDLFEQLETAKADALRLVDLLAEENRPVVVVEGRTDRMHLEMAFRKLFDREIPYAVAAGQNADSVAEFLMSHRKVPINENIAIVGIVDNDPAGNRAVNSTRKSHIGTQFSEFFSLHRERQIFIGNLPKPEHIIRTEDALTFEVPFCIEKLYPPDLLRRACAEGALALRDVCQKATHAGGLEVEVNVSQAYDERLPEELRIYLRREDDDLKEEFVVWLENEEPANFEGFRPLFERLDILVGQGE